MSSPSTVYTDDTITATISTDDPDGDTVSQLRLVCRQESGGGDCRARQQLLRQERHGLCGRDAQRRAEEGAAATSSTRTIQNTAPSISMVSISPASPRPTDTLTRSYSGFADDDSDSDSSTYSWTIDGAEGTSSTLSSGYDADDVVTCTVTPNDGEDDGVALSDSVTMVNTVTGP